MMPEFSTWFAFVVAVLAMQILPEPDMMLVLARGIGQGRRAALGCVPGFPHSSGGNSVLSEVS
jgi:threonine/homoserine/homoserine lactone efflux protein